MVEASQTPSYGLPAPGEVLGGKYRLVRVIGEGAMGVVYEARHHVTGKRAAVKMLQPRAAKRQEVNRRFLQEARASARIEHPNVVDVYDVGEWHGVAFLVMEYLTGLSFGAYLELRGRLTLQETMELLTPICHGVAAAHEQGVIHRDLKPENVFLCVDAGSSSAVPKVLDFGVSKVDDPNEASMTQTGHAIGTALYMPLEQMMGSRHVTPAADVYALGVIIYQCLSGTFPHEARSLAELALRLNEHPPTPLTQRCPDLPEGFWDALSKVLSKDLEVRPASVPALMKLLAPWGLGQGGTSVHSPQITLLSHSAEVLASSRPSASISGDAFLGSGVRRTGTSIDETVASSSPAPMPAVAPTRKAKAPWLAVAAVVLASGAGASLAVLKGRGPAGSSTRVDSPPPVAAPSQGTETAAPPPAHPGVVFARIAAAGHAGATLRIDGADRGLLADDGTLAISLAPGDHLFELVEGGIVVASALRPAREGEGLEVVLATAAAAPAAVPAVGATTAGGAPASGGASHGTPSAPTDAPARQGVRVRGAFHVDPY